MKVLYVILAFFTIQSAMGEIVQPNEQSMDEDLNFKLVEEQGKQRQIASDDESKKEVTTDSTSDSSSERDVASETDKQDNKIQYWTY